MFLTLEDDGNGLRHDFCGGYMTIYLSQLNDTLVHNFY